MAGRNEPCACGSGRRYKDCHGAVTAADEKVAFVIAGTQKGGTTALASYLQAHPEICMSTIKEVHFFDTEEYFASADVDYARYHAHFSPTANARLRGEATPVYMYWEPAPQRIHRYNPAMKLIMLLRNPVTRAYSHWNWNHEHARGHLDPLPFEQALDAEEARRAEAAPLQSKRFSYIDRGFYSAQILRIWRLFPAGQTLILKSEELQREPQATLARITDFLGVARFPSIRLRNLNVRTYGAPMSAEARQRLCEVFAPGVRNLECMLGWDCADWLAI
jgi:hypothetical protein